MNNNNGENLNVGSTENVETFDAQSNSVNNYTLNPEVKEKLDNENNIDSYLIRRYIKQNSDKILGNTVNIPSFFLGSLYYFYRKMYLYGIVIMVLETAIMFLPYYYFWLLVIRLILLFATNKIYISLVYNDVQYIKEHSSDKTRDELAKECAKQGGANVGSVFIGIVLSGILTVGVFFLLSHLGIKVKEVGNISAIWQNVSAVEPNSYNGKLACNYITFKNIDYKIPSGFKKKRNFQEIKATLKSKEETCTLNLRSVLLYKDPETLSKQMSEYYGENLKEEIINGNTWNTLILDDKTSTTKYYIGGFENDVYVYSYTYSNSSCIGKDKSFLESLELD